MNHEGEITCLRDAIGIVDSLRSIVGTDDEFVKGIDLDSFPYGIWFRGEGDHKNPLTPGVFRQYNGGCKVLNEAGIFNHLQSRIPDLYKIDSAFDKLCVAQHYEIPTRLLDWSESILTALYFAASSDPKGESDSYLYVLNAKALNKHSSKAQGKEDIHTPDDYWVGFRAEKSFAKTKRGWHENLQKNYPVFKFTKHWNDEQVGQYKHYNDLNKPISVIPIRQNQRMIVQSSVFTLHGGSNLLKDAMPTPIPASFKDENGVNHRIYKRYKIPYKLGGRYIKKELAKELMIYGVHKGTLFPEMDKQRDYLTTMWQTEPPLQSGNTKFQEVNNA
jgi:hypothetical protein